MPIEFGVIEHVLDWLDRHLHKPAERWTHRCGLKRWRDAGQEQLARRAIKRQSENEVANSIRREWQTLMGLLELPAYLATWRSLRKSEKMLWLSGLATFAACRIAIGTQ
jgi:hypothetical protein